MRKVTAMLDAKAFISLADSNGNNKLSKPELFNLLKRMAKERE
jgi:hypothetical protein